MTTGYQPGRMHERLLLIGLIGLGTLTGLMGIDLILPAVPALPAVFSTTASAVQLVLAAYVLGTAAGLAVIGDLAGRMDRGLLLTLSMAGFGGASYAATLAGDIETLIGLRFVQGFAGAAPAVMAPGLIRRLFSERGALQAIGTLGSVESLVPALAPVVGVWLLTLGDWRLSFWVCAGLGAALSVGLFAMKGRLPPGPARARDGSYRTLLASKPYMTTSLAHAFSLGSLLVFVFGAPAVIVTTMGGTLADFIRMQVVGIACFILAANLAPRFALKFGARRMMLLGSTVGLIGFGLLIALAVRANADPFWLTPAFLFVNLGFGMRAPVTFHQAIVAAGGDDNRGSSLLVLLIMLVAGAGTAAVAPLIAHGLLALTMAALALHITAIALTLSLAPDVTLARETRD